MRIIHSYITLLACFCLVACSSEKIEPGDEIPPVPDVPEEPIAVSFSSKLYLEPETRAENEESLLADANVVIYVYKQTSVGVPAEAPLLQRSYKVGKNGDLAENVAGEPMYLGAGSYTFYALSVNAAGADATALPPELVEGAVAETVELKNQTDYLYCAVNQAIVSNPTNVAKVSLPFKRLAARIQIQIVSEGGDDKIVSADAPTVRLPLTDPSGSKIKLGNDPALATGNPVSDTGKYSVLQSKGDVANGFVADCILLPMQTGKQPLPVTILFPSITFSGLGELKNKVYTLSIPIPSPDGFASGKQYNYKVNITGNEVGFSGMTVVPWKGGTSGDLSGDDVTEDW